MKRNVVKDKSFAFAVRIVKLYTYMMVHNNEYILSKQIVRSGTSIGALIREAEYAETKKDFAHKLGIAQKETNETIYWLEFLKTVDFVSDKEFESMHNDAVELMKLITSILKTTKSAENIINN